MKRLFSDNPEMMVLFEEFVQKKLQKYVEPQRAGTAKGDPIGFSRKKYAASLMAIGPLTFKQIAFKLGISYGVMRNWNIEKTFREKVHKHHTEFLKLLEERGISILPPGNTMIFVCPSCGKEVCRISIKSNNLSKP